MENAENLWIEVRDKCLQRASELLDDKTAPAAATAETVRTLVETAISMDMLNLHRAEKTRYGAAVFKSQVLLPSNQKTLKGAQQNERN